MDMQTPLSRHNDFSRRSYSRSLHISHPHTAWCGGTVLLDLPEGWEGSSGHVMRSGTGGVSGRYFSEEKICVSGYQPVRWAAAVLLGLQHEQCGDTRQQQQTAVLCASSYVIGPGGTCAFTCTPARARHTQLVTTGAITRLQPVLYCKLRWVTRYIEPPN